MERGVNAVRDSLAQSGKVEHFEVLKQWLVGDVESLSQADAAATLGTSTGAVKVAIHRMRQKFSEAIRQEIAAVEAGKYPIEQSPLRHAPHTVHELAAETGLARFSILPREE